MRHVPISVAIILLAGVSLHAEDWPAWRGPTANGFSNDIGFPLTWSAEDNVKWRTELPGPGNSTPIIIGG